jgi:hypothetical protein
MNSETKDTEDSIARLEKVAGRLERIATVHSTKKWEAFAIVGIWISVAIVSFSPAGMGNIGSIGICAVLGTGAVLRYL